MGPPGDLGPLLGQVATSWAKSWVRACHGLIEKGHVAYQSIRMAYCRPKYIYGVFIALVGLYQKLLQGNLP